MVVHEDKIKLQHRREFNLAVFGTTFEPGEPAPENFRSQRKALTKVEYDAIVQRLRFPELFEINDTNQGRGRVQRSSFDRKWDKEKFLHRLEIIKTGPDETPVEHLQYYVNAVHGWRIKVHNEMVFDAVYAIHEAVGHRKVGVMRTIAFKKYDNVTERHCKILCATCPICNRTNPTAIPPPTSNNPYRFRDKFTICTIDYSCDPVSDINGVLMKYLLVVRDEATKFTVLRPVCDVDSKTLQYELKHVFGLIGYPRQIIQHPDDLFDARISSLKEIVNSREPNCVEQLVSSEEIEMEVARVISSLFAETRSKAVDTAMHENQLVDWLTLVPHAMETMNRTSYTQVFGMDFTLPGLSDMYQEMKVETVNDEEEFIESILTSDPESDTEDVIEEVMLQVVDVVDKQDGVSYVHLLCDRCDRYSAYSRLVLPLQEDSYYDKCMGDMHPWSIDLINVFGVLKYHQMHQTDIIFMDTRTPMSADGVRQVEVDRKKLPSDVESVVTVAARGGHIVVMQLKLAPDNTTVVYDFRKDKSQNDLDHWKDHETSVLNRCGVIKNESSLNRSIRYHVGLSDFRRKFDVVQTVDSDSGPIACRVLWELLSPGSVEATFGQTVLNRKGDPIRRLVDNVIEWRKICIVELKTMTKQYGGIHTQDSDDDSKKPKAKRMRE